MKSERLLDKIKALFKTELEEVQTAEGSVLYADMFEVGEAVFIVQDEERIALPVGEYLLEDGRTLVVTEEGIIAEIKTAEAETEEEEEVVEEEMEQQPQSLSKEDVISIVKEVLAELDLEKATKEAINEKVTEMKTELSKQVQELYENQPEEEGPKPNPEGRVKMKKNIATGDRILNRLYNNY